MSKWMVIDTLSNDQVFHGSEESAKKDFEEAVKWIEEDSDDGIYQVYMFEVKQQREIAKGM